MTATPIVITLAGPERVGKSTTALSIVHEGNRTGKARFKSIAFSDPIYKCVSELTRIPVSFLHQYKETPIGVIAHDQGLSSPAAFKDLTPRQVLRRFGSEAVRNTFGQDVWLDHAKARIAQLGADVVVIEDARRPVEYAFGRLIALSRAGLSYSGAHDTDCAPPVDMVWRALDLDGMSPRVAGETLAAWALELVPS